MTVTEASFSNARAVETGTGPILLISQRSPGSAWPRTKGGLSAMNRMSTGLHGPAVAKAMLNDASVTVMLREGDEITAVSSPKRTIPAKLRRSLETRYPTCGVTTCANDQLLQIDHVVPLEDGGETNVHNTWRICSHRHFLKTYAGWRVSGEPGNWDLVPPDGPDPPALHDDP